MGYLLNYAFSSAIYLAIGYVLYRITFSGARQYTFNRILIHCIVLISLIMPIVRNQEASVSPISIDMQQIPTDLDFIPVNTSIDSIDKPILPTILLWVYCIGALVVFIKYIYSIHRIRQLIKSGEKKNVRINGVNVRMTILQNSTAAPFSWLHSVVVGENDLSENGDAILLHEVGHIRRIHSVDMMVYMFFLIFQWFNPAAWLLVDELRSVHEYQADSDVIHSGVDIRNYQMMLIKKAIGESFPLPVNCLNHSNLKKRIAMMYKSKSTLKRKSAALLLLPCLLLAMFLSNLPAVASFLSSVSNATLDIPYLKKGNNEASGQNIIEPIPESTTNDLPDKNIPDSKKDGFGNYSSVEKKDKNNLVILEKEEYQSNTSRNKEVILMPDKVAEYPGGMSELSGFFANNIKYPKEELDNLIQGRVIVRFLVREDGSISSPSVIRGISPQLDEEAIRLVNLMPKWIPAETEGKAVPSFFTLPIRFQIPDDMMSE